MIDKKEQQKKKSRVKDIKEIIKRKDKNCKIKIRKHNRKEETG